MTDLSFCANHCPKNSILINMQWGRLFPAMTETVLLYSVRSWTLTDALGKQFYAVHTWILRAAFYEHCSTIGRQSQADFSTIWNSREICLRLSSYCRTVGAASCSWYREGSNWKTTSSIFILTPGNQRNTSYCLCCIKADFGTKPRLCATLTLLETIRLQLKTM